MVDIYNKDVITMQAPMDTSDDALLAWTLKEGGLQITDHILMPSSMVRCGRLDDARRRLRDATVVALIGQTHMLPPTARIDVNVWRLVCSYAFA